MDVSPNPITQPVTDASGNNVSQVFLPTAKDWKTNLFVVTSKRDYSLELNVLDHDSPRRRSLSVTTIRPRFASNPPPPAPHVRRSSGKDRRSSR
ncbi:P-type conjugative transfer protein VirB9 [Klebsiella aerogenes]|nr:P-type conjugative transfer protein VirB9 [Klebsiella aerogenes]